MKAQAWKAAKAKALVGFFHLRSIPGAVWPPLPAAEVSQTWTAYQTLDRTQWLSPGELEKLQLGQLRELVSHCVRHVPYYRRLLEEAGLASRPIESLADYRRLPLLTRELYQAHAAELRAGSLPAGITEAGHAFTSGTSGVPLKVLHTSRTALWWQACYLRNLEWAGLDPRLPLASIRLLAIKRDDLPKFLAGVSARAWSPFLEPLIEAGPAYGMDIRQDPRVQLRWLERIKPSYLLSMPSNLEVLAGMLREAGGRLAGLLAIQAVGEPLDDDRRRRIEEGFGVPVKDLYSSTEAGYMASPCPSGAGLHVHAENILAEVLDADGNPCEPGQTGRLVFTALHQFLAPFLRYHIQDEVTLAPGPCPCGRGLPLWARVDGRRLPLLHLPDGRSKASIWVTLVLRQVGGCHQFQAIQRARDHVVIRVVPDRTWTPDHAARMRRAIQDGFGAPIRVDVEEHGCLPRPDGGKLNIIVNEMEGGAASPQP